MKCPKCQKKMIVKNMELTAGFGNKWYNKTVFWCEEDDIWISVEVPDVKHNVA